MEGAQVWWLPGVDPRWQAAARLLIALSTAAVLLAVAFNFARSEAAGDVARQRRSPVATGTMIGFFVAVWWLLSRRVGQVASPGPMWSGMALLVGTTMVVVGATVNVLGRHNLGRNWANQVTVYEAQTLVTSGVYGWLRHPLYASLIWMFLGASLAYHNAAAMAATLAVFVPAMYVRSNQEEAMLSERFPEYAAYRARTGRFCPFRRAGDSYGQG